MVIKIISKGNKIEEKPITPKVGKIKIVKKREPTILQEKVIRIAKENLVANGRKSRGAILREAGASEAVARHPDRVFGSAVVQEALNPVVKQIRDIRSKALEALEKKEFTKESAFNLTMIVGMLTKDSELLDGKPTDRTTYELPQEEKDRLDKILAMNS